MNINRKKTNKHWTCFYTWTLRILKTREISRALSTKIKNLKKYAFSSNDITIYYKWIHLLSKSKLYFPIFSAWKYRQATFLKLIVSRLSRSMLFPIVNLNVFPCIRSLGIDVCFLLKITFFLKSLNWAKAHESCYFLPVHAMMEVQFLNIVCANCRVIQ